MKKLQVCIIALLAISLAVAAVAGEYNKKSLIGTWEFDMLKLMKVQMGGQVPEGMDVEQMLKGMYIRITFVKDGTFTFESKTPMGAETENGKWELVKSEESTLTLSIESSKEEGEKETVTIVFSDKDNFDAMMPSPNGSVEMSATRVKEDAKMEKKEG